MDWHSQHGQHQGTPRAPVTYLMLPPDGLQLCASRGRLPSADVIVVDMCDRLPVGSSVAALAQARGVDENRQIWLRTHKAATDECAEDLAAVRVAGLRGGLLCDRADGLASGVVLPGVRSVEDVDWAARRCPSELPLIAVLDVADEPLRPLGVARHPSVARLGFDTSAFTPGPAARHLVAASGAAGLPGPVGGLGSCEEELFEVLLTAALVARTGFAAYCTGSVGHLPHLRGVLAERLSAHAPGARAKFTTARNSP